MNLTRRDSHEARYQCGGHHLAGSPLEELRRHRVELVFSNPGTDISSGGFTELPRRFRPRLSASLKHTPTSKLGTPGIMTPAASLPGPGRAMPASEGLLRPKRQPRQRSECHELPLGIRQREPRNPLYGSVCSRPQRRRKCDQVRHGNRDGAGGQHLPGSPVNAGILVAAHPNALVRPSRAPLPTPAGPWPSPTTSPSTAKLSRSAAPAPPASPAHWPTSAATIPTPATSWPSTHDRLSAQPDPQRQHQQGFSNLAFGGPVRSSLQPHYRICLATQRRYRRSRNLAGRQRRQCQRAWP